VASDLPAEFALIARHFRPLAGPGALDLQDDAAVLTMEGQQPAE
jgi:thiamine-monophosphate kinase